MRQNAKQTLNKKTGNAINRSTKIKANLSKKSIDKLTSGKALHKSIANGFSAKEHYEAVGKIKVLYRKSIQINTHPDKNGDPNILCIRRFKTQYKNANVLITVKSYTNGFSKLYSLELQK